MENKDNLEVNEKLDDSIQLGDMDSPIGKPLKVQYRHELKKLREMSFGGKVKYIWEYYKLHLIGLILFLSILISLLNVWFFNPPAQPILTVAWSAGFIFDENIADLKNVLYEDIIDETKNETVEVMLLLPGAEEDPQMFMAYITRLMAMVAARQLDIFVLNPDQLLDHANNGFIMPMEDILADIRTAYPAVYSRMEDAITYIQYEFEDYGPQEHIMGIKISDSPLFLELDLNHGFMDRKMYFSAVINTDNIENVTRALILFFDP